MRLDLRSVGDTLSSIATTPPKGTPLLKARLSRDAATQRLRNWLRAVILAARSIRASNSPPNKLLRGLVSPGKTMSVITVRDSFGVLGCIIFLVRIEN